MKYAAFAAGLAYAILCAGCSWMQAHETQIQKTVRDVDSCIEQNLDGPAPLVGNVFCGIAVTQDLVALFEQKKQARTLHRLEGYAEHTATMARCGGK